ncbi:MAG: hypothetical protein WCF23_06390 [Candidatus Nitrosopolaris sp.]
MIATILKSNILSTRLVGYWYLPTQIPIGQGPYTKYLIQTIPYYKELISMIPYGHNRPIIPEYPQIADHIRHTIDEVFNRTRKPKQALDEAAARAAQALVGSIGLLLSIAWCSFVLRMTNDAGEQLFQILSHLIVRGYEKYYRAGSIAQNIINDVKSVLNVIRIGYSYNVI